MFAFSDCFCPEASLGYPGIHSSEPVKVDTGSSPASFPGSPCRGEPPLQCPARADPVWGTCIGGSGAGGSQGGPRAELMMSLLTQPLLPVPWSWRAAASLPSPPRCNALAVHQSTSPGPPGEQAGYAHPLLLAEPCRAPGKVHRESTDPGTASLLPGVPAAGLPAGSPAASVLLCAGHVCAPRIKHQAVFLKKKKYPTPGGTFHSSPCSSPQAVPACASQPAFCSACESKPASLRTRAIDLRPKVGKVADASEQ